MSSSSRGAQQLHDDQQYGNNDDNDHRRDNNSNNGFTASDQQQRQCEDDEDECLLVPSAAAAVAAATVAKEEEEDDDEDAFSDDHHREERRQRSNHSGHDHDHDHQHHFERSALLRNDTACGSCVRRANPCTEVKRTFTLRLCFVLSMVIAGAVCGYIAYAVTHGLQRDVALQTYESVASSALEEAAAIAQRKQQGGRILSSIMGNAFPRASDWPNVGLRGYPEIALNVAKQSATSGHGLMVIVRPDQVASFESHAKKLYEEFEYPAEAGVSEGFGFGIYGNGPNNTRFHDVTGETAYDSKYSIMAPFLQHSNTFKKPSLLMMNIHQHAFRGLVMDSIIDCAARAEAADPEFESTSTYPSCGVVTDFTEIFIRPGPSAVFFYPVFPAANKTKVVGFIGTSIHWEEVLTNVVPDYIDGLDCVISQGTKSNTYVIRNGKPQHVGEGDLHDRAFDHYGAHNSVRLNENDETGATASFSYTLTIYPTKAMFEEFDTQIPIIVGLGFVAVIILCTLIFFLYDFFMKYESHQRKKILEHKRRFVRFVSHEIRTPLNVVKMGLELLQGELRDSIDEATTCTATTTATAAPPRAAEKVEEEQPQRQNSNNVRPSCAGTVRADLKSRGDKKASGQGRSSHPNESITSTQLVIRTEEEQRTTTTSREVANASYWLDLTGDIVENTLNAVGVLNDLLNYDKIESGTFKLEFSVVDIWKVTSKTLSEFKIQARNRHISLDLLFTAITKEEAKNPDNNECCDDDRSHSVVDNPKDLIVVGDEIRLTQAIRNLISNAIKFSSEGGKITVTAAYDPNGLPNAASSLPQVVGRASNRSEAANMALAHRRAGSIQISVKDDGVGLSKEQLRMLFREGVQFDANKLQGGGGSGLGLCITKEILQHHGGTIEASSKGRGYGTTFSLEIPLYEDGDKKMILGGRRSGSTKTLTTATTTKEEKEGAASATDDPESTHLTSSGASLTSKNSVKTHRHVLVVDDVISNTKMLVRLLERSGHRCQVAMNGQEAIDAFIKNRDAPVELDDDDDDDVDVESHVPFDTILMDYQMPVCDGPTATKRLREMGCKAYIIGVTGNVLSEDVALFKSSGADHVLPKPISFSAIEACWAYLD